MIYKLRLKAKCRSLQNISDFNKHIENLDGDRMMKFIKNNVESDNTLDRFTDDKNVTLF